MLLFIVNLLLSLVVVQAWNIWTDEHDDGPGSRAGHTLITHQNYIYLFGGRGNEIEVIHDPKTYEVANANGTLYFESYDQRHVVECFDSNGVSNNDPASNLTREEYEACYNITVGTYYNDIWRYNLDCDRPGDGACLNSGWELVKAHARLGGCYIYDEREICSHPFERWEHNSAMLARRERVVVPEALYLSSYSSLSLSPSLDVEIIIPSEEPSRFYELEVNEYYLIIYGGYAQMCEDYCSDVWSFPISRCDRNSSLCEWEQLANLGREGPGRRWRASSVFTDQYMLIFGGHRLWHGFSGVNTHLNRWNSSEEYPFGGYLDDIWFFSLTADGPTSTFTEPLDSGVSERRRGGIYNYTEGGVRDLPLGPLVAVGANAAFQQLLPRESCFFHEKIDQWDHRDARICTVIWPDARAGAGLSLDPAKQILYLFGGYRVEHPYPNMMSKGAGPGTGTAASDSLSAYPSLPFFLDDLWRFDLRSSLWEQLRPTGYSSTRISSHSIATMTASSRLVASAAAGTGVAGVSSSGVITERGQRQLNDLLDDEQKDSLRQAFQLTHSRDGVPIGRRGMQLVTLSGGALLMYGGYSENFFLSDLWLYNASANHWLELAHHTHPLYPVNCTSDVYIDPESGLEMPFVDAEGRARTSVAGEPTRFRTIDGKFGRASAPVFVNQTRRRAPFWDGCRDRADEREDLPQELMYLKPSRRARYAMTYSSMFDLVLLYGGETLSREERPAVDRTYGSVAAGDLWVWSKDQCIGNCSGHGLCHYGSCYCNEGFYGIDCSNMTCPGDFCSYDELNHVQICQHCCSAPYVHHDYDTYLSNLPKLQCSAELPGTSHGICNGFGVCQCEPPFLTDDCSVKDCKNNCSGHGWCSVEYPVSRCLCTLPFAGDDCSQIMCLNNCSYPNGNCVDGHCVCEAIMSPYNRTAVFSYWEGDDCSYIVPFAGARETSIAVFAIVAVMFAVLGLL